MDANPQLLKMFEVAANCKYKKGWRCPGMPSPFFVIMNSYCAAATRQSPRLPEPFLR